MSLVKSKQSALEKREMIERVERAVEINNDGKKIDRSGWRKFANAFMRESSQGFRVALYAPEGGCGATHSTDNFRDREAAMLAAYEYCDKKQLKIDWRDIEG